MPLGVSCDAALSINQWFLSVKVKSNVNLDIYFFLFCLILMVSLEVKKHHFPSFRPGSWSGMTAKPESSVLRNL